MAEYDVPLGYLGNPVYICGGGSLIINVLIICFAALLSMYGLWALSSHASRVSKNSRLLVIAAAAITLIPVSDLVSRANFPPGEQFWHAMNFLLGIMGIFFIYRFVSVLDAKEPLGRREIMMELAAAVLFAIAFCLVIDVFKSVPSIVTAAYGLLGIALMVLIYMVFGIIRKLSENGKAFSSRSFTLAILPLISLSMLGLALSQIPAELMVAVLKMPALDASLVFLRGAQSAFYLVIGTLVMVFGYAVSKISAFYGKGEPKAKKEKQL